MPHVSRGIFREPSPKKSLAKRGSIKSLLKREFHLNMPKGLGMVTHLNKLLKKRGYRSTTISLTKMLKSDLRRKK